VHSGSSEAVLIFAAAPLLLLRWCPPAPPRLSAALLRQATYTTTRLGVYNSLEERFSSADGKPPSFLAKAAIGMTAGAAGAVVGTPSEVALVRMMSDGRLPLEQRRGYKNVFDALWRVVTEEGVLTLWRGTGPTVLRAMALNAAQLASYSQAKELLARYAGLKDGIPLHFSASLCSGFIATAVSLPVDITKTKIQTMKVVNGVPEYKGAVDVLVKTVQREGILRLWKGCVRGAPAGGPGKRRGPAGGRGAALTRHGLAPTRLRRWWLQVHPVLYAAGPAHHLHLPDPGAADQVVQGLGRQQVNLPCLVRTPNHTRRNCWQHPRIDDVSCLGFCSLHTVHCTTRKNVSPVHATMRQQRRRAANRHWHTEFITIHCRGSPTRTRQPT